MAMTLRLSEDDERILADLAASQGISRREAIIRAVHEAAARRSHEAAVQELSQGARARYSDVLDRLGK